MSTWRTTTPCSSSARQRKGNRSHVRAEEDFVCAAIQEVCYGCARGGNHGIAAPAGDKRAARVGVRLLEIVPHRVQHALGHLGTGGAIQEYRGMPIDGHS